MAAKSKTSKKKGRNAIECKAYQNSGTREKNKLRKLLKRLETHPADAVAVEAAERLKKSVRGF